MKAVGQWKAAYRHSICDDDASVLTDEGTCPYGRLTAHTPAALWPRVEDFQGKLDALCDLPVQLACLRVAAWSTLRTPTNPTCYRLSGTSLSVAPQCLQAIDPGMIFNQVTKVYCKIFLEICRSWCLQLKCCVCLQ